MGYLPRRKYREVGIVQDLPVVELRNVWTGTAQGKRSERLTDREHEYVVLVCRSEEPTRAQIAQLMDCKENTVESHRANVYRKWNVHSRTELLYKAVKLGMVKCPCGRGPYTEGAEQPARP